MTPWTVAHQAPLSMKFSRKEYLRGLPFPSPGDIPGLGIKPGSPTLQADFLLSEPSGKGVVNAIFTNTVIQQFICISGCPSTYILQKSVFSSSSLLWSKSSHDISLHFPLDNAKAYCPSPSNFLSQILR